MTDHNILTIVDAHDNPIGTKRRGEITPEDTYRVSALWLTNSRGDVLLAQRKWNKKNDPGKWGPAVAGTVEAHETYGQNIIKEAAEEIGLTGVDFTLGPKTFSSAPYKFFCQWYFAKVDQPAGDFKIEADDLEAVAWFPRQKLLDQLSHNPEIFLSTAPKVWRKLLQEPVTLPSRV